MKRKHWLGLVALGIVLIVSAGCLGLVVGAAAGAGAVAYVRGELKATEEAPIDKVFEATKGAITDLEFTLIKGEADAYSGKVTAKSARGNDIGISLKRKGDNVTRIGIRVDELGDEELSRLILEKIKARLATS